MFGNNFQNNGQQNNFTQGVRQGNGGQKRQISDQEKALLGTRITLEGFLYFPKIANPEPAHDGVPRWGAVLGIDLTNLTPANQQALQQASQVVAGLKQIHFPNIPDQMFQIQGNPLKIWGQNFRQDGQPHPEFYENKVWINVSKRKEAPPIVVRNGGQLVSIPTNSPEIFFGQKVAMTLTFYPSGLTNSQAKKGVGANLEAMLVIGGGTKIAGESAPPVDVNAAFANFASDTAGLNANTANMSGFMNQPAQNFQAAQPNQQASNFGQNFQGNQGGQGNFQNAQTAQNPQVGFGMANQVPAQTAFPSNTQQTQQGQTNFGQNFGPANSNPFQQTQPNQGQQQNQQGFNPFNNGSLV